MYYDHVIGQLRLEPDGTMSILDLNRDHERAFIAVQTTMAEPIEKAKKGAI